MWGWGGREQGVMRVLGLGSWGRDVGFGGSLGCLRGVGGGGLGTLRRACVGLGMS